MPDPPPSTLPISNAPNIACPERPLPPHNRQLSARYQDLLSRPPSPVVDPQLATSSSSTIPRVFLYVFDSFCTQLNKFGLTCAYQHRPLHDPDVFLPNNKLSQTRDPIISNSAGGKHSDHLPPWPWTNMLIWHLMMWKNTGSTQKSHSEVTHLVHEVLQAPNFNLQDLSNFNASRETARFDTAQKGLPPGDPFGIDKWKCTAVDILVPTREKKEEGNGQMFTVGSLLYKPITDVVRAVFSEASSKTFHLTPFKWIWKSPITGHKQCVYDELYASNVWNEAHDEIMKQRRDSDCKLERVITGLMFWSDSTQLTQMGHVSAWPIYLFFGNLSKYASVDPQSGCCHPITFIPLVGRFLFLTSL